MSQEENEKNGNGKEEAIEKEILAVPRVKLLPVPTCEELRELRLYSSTKQKDECGNYIFDENGNHVIIRGIYDAGVVEYRKRNRIIIVNWFELTRFGIRISRE